MILQAGECRGLFKQCCDGHCFVSVGQQLNHDLFEAEDVVGLHSSSPCEGSSISPAGRLVEVRSS